MWEQKAITLIVMINLHLRRNLIYITSGKLNVNAVYNVHT